MQLLDKEQPLFQELVEQVQKKTMNPVDGYEVAAVMETMGWDDLMVKEQFGAEDIFDIAQTVWEVVQSRLDILPVLHTEKIESHPHFIQVFHRFILKNYLAKDSAIMNKKYVSAYIVVAVLAFIITISLYLFLNALSDANIIHLNVFENPTTLFTFVWAVIAYSMLALALLNCLILFSLGQLTMVFYSILIALTVDVFVGFLLSRWIDYSFAVVGLLLDSIVFTVLTTKQVLNVLKNLDYYLYVSNIHKNPFFPSAFK